MGRMNPLIALLILASGCADPDGAYDDAERTDTVEAYDKVLLEHPGHERSAAAKKRLGELRWRAASESRELRAVQLVVREHGNAAFAPEARRLLDDLTWAAARDSNSRNACVEYLTDFPEGLHVAAAKTCVENLDWQAALDSKSIKAVDAFLDQYPLTTRRSDAATVKWELRQREYSQLFDNDDVEELLKRKPEEVREAVRELFWWSPLILAANRGSLKIAAHLIAQGADVNARADDQSTALHQAARSGAVDVAMLLLKHKADVDTSIEREASFVRVERDGSLAHHRPRPTAMKGTPIHWAAYHNRPEVAKVLIEAGANVNADDGYGNTAVHFAAQAGNLDLIRTLVASGAKWKKAPDKNRARPDATPLHYAKTIEVAKYFIGEGVSVHLDSDLGQPIHAAAHFGHTDVIGFLIEQGVEVDEICDWVIGPLKSVHATPLWIAAWDGRVDVIEYLVGKGGDRKYQVRHGGSLLHAAAMTGRADAIRYLVDKGLEVDLKCNFPHGHPMVAAFEDFTPLGVAVHYQRIDAVRALLEVGANRTAKLGLGWEVHTLETTDAIKALLQTR